MKKILFMLLATAIATPHIQASPTLAEVPAEAPAKAPAGYTELGFSPASWNESPDMKFYGSSSNISVSSSKIYMDAYYTTDAQSMIVEFTTTESSVFSFKVYASSLYTPIRMYCDGTLSRTLTPLDGYRTFFLDVDAGEHQIKFEADGNSSYFYFQEMGVINVPLISVELIEPGSLGTEILYNDVERLQDVRNLKIKGTLNDDDVDKLSMMKDNLVRLDLSEANLPVIRKSLFSSASRLKTVILPENLKTIEDYAFEYCNIEHIEFPESLVTIGQTAFYETNLIEAIMPDATVNLGQYVFGNCKLLKQVRLSDNLTVIPSCCFYECYKLENFELPPTLKTIESYAFYRCHKINMDFPETLQSIGSSAFSYTNNSDNNKGLLTIHEGCSVGLDAFAYTCYTSAILPTSYTSVSTTLPNTITKIKLKSATVVSNDSHRMVNDECRANVTLEVPSYLVNSYKLDSYWYNFKEVVGFDTEEIDYWNVKADLVLNARDRMLGTPSIDISKLGSIKINGTDAMPINNLHLYVNLSWYKSNNRYGRIFSNADGVTINGDLGIDMYIDYEKQWFFISLPFDVKVSDIKHLGDGLVAVRYYNGANRALNGATGSWTNYDADAVIPAGTGFIVNVNKEGTLRFTAQDNDSKQYITSNRMFVTPLDANASDVASNRGWNLVGNPYQCFYNIHKLNFTAPITVRNQNNYEAYSIIDDDYAIAPNQAFFVQCPDGVSSITFPLDGRQMTAEIVSQQGAPAKNPQCSSRRLSDIVVNFGEDTDRTRVVLNESASTEYEISCDASKFFSDNVSMVQLYTIEDGEYYAINERPLLDGKVALGFIAGERGKYTISMSRNDNDHVYLLDLMTGVETDLSANSYSFDSEAGTFDNRFQLSIENNTSLIQTVGPTNAVIKANDGRIVAEGCGNVEVYNLAGVKVADLDASGNASADVIPGVYLVKTANGVVKVSVK